MAQVTIEKHNCYFCKEDAPVEHADMWTCRHCSNLYDKLSKRIKTAREEAVAVLKKNRTKLDDNRILTTEGPVTVFNYLDEHADRKTKAVWPSSSVTPIEPVILEPSAEEEVRNN